MHTFSLPKAQLRRWMGGIGLADSADLVLYHVGKLLVGVWCDVCPKTSIGYSGKKRADIYDCLEDVPARREPKCRPLTSLDPSFCNPQT
jgi:hypothetical protein